MKFTIIFALAALLSTAAAQGLGDLPDCSVCVYSQHTSLLNVPPAKTTHCIENLCYRFDPRQLRH